MSLHFLYTAKNGQNDTHAHIHTNTQAQSHKGCKHHNRVSSRGQEFSSCPPAMLTSPSVTGESTIAEHGRANWLSSSGNVGEVGEVGAWVIRPFWTSCLSVIGVVSDRVSLSDDCLTSLAEYLDPEDVVDLVRLRDLPEWLRKMFRWSLAGVLQRLASLVKSSSPSSSSV